MLTPLQPLAVPNADFSALPMGTTSTMCAPVKNSEIFCWSLSGAGTLIRYDQVGSCVCCACSSSET